MAAGGGIAGHAAPFVLTLELDGDAFARLDDLRRRFFPPERNLVPAHLTLFHQLPGDRGREIKSLLRQAAEEHSRIELEVGEVKNLDRGVAVFVRSARLQALRGSLAAEWWPWLTGQDTAGFRPHITVQNKVDPAEARQTQRAVALEFRLRSFTGTGLHLWRYLGGPWEHVQLFRFR